MGARVLTSILGLSLLILGVHSANFATTPPFFGQQYTTMASPRALFLDPSGDILVLSRSGQAVIALTEVENGDGTVSVVQNRIANTQGINHGLTFFQGYLYASSQVSVFRWPYVPGNRTLITTPPEVVVNGIPNGGHDTRTIIFDEQSRLYVAIGSAGNVDQNSNRARVRRFDFSSGFPPGGINFNDGVVFADGLRNEVGLDFDSRGILWGVENGADQLNRPDLGGDIHNGNPAEDFNKFDQPVGTHYGYPFCWAAFNLAGHPAGTQFAWPSFMNDGVHTDAFCRNPANNRPPTMIFGAHHAPLGVSFYRGTGCESTSGSFPCDMNGDAFVAFHGSWNSDLKVGYRVAWLKFNKETGDPTGESVNVIYEPNLTSCGNGCFRPVNAVLNAKGHLIVSTDDSNELFKVTYGFPPPPIRN